MGSRTPLHPPWLHPARSLRPACGSLWYVLEADVAVTILRVEIQERASTGHSTSSDLGQITFSSVSSFLWRRFELAANSRRQHARLFAKIDVVYHDFPREFIHAHARTALKSIRRVHCARFHAQCTPHLPFRHAIPRHVTISR